MTYALFSLNTYIYAEMDKLVTSYMTDCAPFGIICFYE